jgi:thioesterase domain-containing protein/NAD(P)-dependent dehydrogenase (short-subunit alcohol dehydrogenase family)/acyl carrier protein
MSDSINISEGSEFVHTWRERNGDHLWFYRRAWNLTEIPTIESTEPATWLLFMDNAGLGRQISEQLKGAEHHVIEVNPGRTFTRTGKRKYCIRPGCRSDYDTLIVDIAKHGRPPQKVLHLWAMLDGSGLISLDEAIDLNFSSLLYFSQAFGNQDLGSLSIAVVSNHLQSISGEPVKDPLRGTSLGPAKFLSKMFPGITGRVIDCDPAGQGTSYVAMQIITELCAASRDVLVAYRGEERWVETLAPMEFRPQSGISRLKPCGTYLITGAFGELALALAEKLVSNFRARVILLDGANLLDSENWQTLLESEVTPASSKLIIKKLIQLQDAGGELITICADVARQDEMKRAVQLAYEKFGAINGVLYAAGVTDEESEQRINNTDIFAARIKGVLILTELLRERPVDFFALLSFAASSCPPKEQMKYEATTAFLDALAATKTHASLVSITLGSSQGIALAKSARISGCEGASAVVQVLSSGMLPTITVSKDQLPKVCTFKTTIRNLGAGVSQDDVEGTLMDWWQDLLDLESVGLNEDFLELGGNSLIGLQLFSKIKNRYGVSLKLTTLSEARTVAQLAQIIRCSVNLRGQAQPRPWSPLVPVQPKGSRLPLFVISGLGGNVIKFHTLGFHLGAEQPIYGLLPRGLYGNDSYHTRIEDMASDYVTAIRNKQPEGLYHVAGYSFGGIVAFEVAQQITAQGGKVGLLALFDTVEWHYSDRVDQSLRPAERFHVLQGHLQNIILSADRGSYIRSILGDRSWMIKSRLFRALGRPLPQKLESIEEVNSHAASRYYPSVYPGKLTLFRSLDRTIQQGSDDFLGWGKFASGGVDVHHIPATHFNILQEPVVRVLAEKLQTCLERTALPH